MLGIARGALEGLSTKESLLEAGTLDASGGGVGGQDGEEDSRDAGVCLEGSMRVGSPLPRAGGLIAGMEREATEAGAGGWFNRNLSSL